LRTYIVIGMHRSGTSFLAKALQKHGVNMGKKLMGPYKGDEIDHCENMEFVTLDREMLAMANDGKTFHSGLMPPDEAVILALAGEYGPQIERVVKLNSDRTWGWKDPYTALLIKLYMPYVLAIDDDPFIYCCFRRPEKIADSLRRRQGLNPEAGAKIAREYQRRIISFLKEFLELDNDIHPDRELERP
jgi:hypothetical protein